jgi:hypothetical protein
MGRTSIGSRDLVPRQRRSTTDTIVGVVTLKYEEIQDQRSSIQRRKLNWREKEKKERKERRRDLNT